MRVGSVTNSSLIPKKAAEDGKIIFKKTEEFNAKDFRTMEKNAKAMKLLYFGLVLMSILASLSAGKLRKFGMPFKLLMKAQVK